MLSNVFSKRSFVTGRRKLAKSQNILCRKPPMNHEFLNKPIINGTSLDTIRTVKAVDPRTERKICDIRVCDEADTSQAIDAARKAFDSTAWQQSTLSERNRILQNISNKMDNDREYLAMLESYDTGKTLDQSFAEIDACVDWITSITSNPKLNKISLNSINSNSTTKNGVVGVILPWHRTMYDLISKVSGLVQSGNTCVIKPSLRASLSSIYLAQLCLDAGLPQGVLNVILGGTGVGRVLIDSNNVDNILFSGSERTANSIRREIGKLNNNKSITDNSRNKNILNKISFEINEQKRSYFIITNNINMSDLRKISEFISDACFLQCGQNVELPKRIFVNNDIYPLFIECIKDIVSNIVVGDPFYDLEFTKKSTNQGPMQNEKELNKVLTLMTEFEQNQNDSSFSRSLTMPSKLNTGGNYVPKLIYGGNRIGNSGYFMEPTIFGDVTDNMSITKFGKNVYGPIMQVSRYETSDEVIECVNKNFKHTMGGAGVFTQDTKEMDKFEKMLNVNKLNFNNFEHPLLRSYDGRPAVKIELQAERD